MAAQNFTLKPTGFVNTDEPNLDYVVLHYDGVAKEELYKRILSYMNTQYRNPDKVLTTIENEQITINGMSDAEIKKPYADLHYNIVLWFKDGKIRMDAPVPEMKYLLNDLSFRRIFINLDKKGFLSDNHGIWFKGKLALPNVKSQLEDFFNRELADIKQAGSAENDW